jgi:hypothetical protein
MTPHTPPSTREKITVTGSQLLAHAQRLLQEGNIRRIVLSHEGQTIAEFPLTCGVVGAVLAPVLAAMGALAALMTECTIEIERAEDVPRSATMRPPGAGEGRRAARDTDAISPGNMATVPGGPEGEGVEPEPPEDIRRGRHA